jgi:cytosine/adenosine deaminase-related metal-dependent hydrolase
MNPIMRTAFCVLLFTLASHTLCADLETVTEYAWHAGDTPAGETVITRSGDGRISNESFIHWNNREYRIDSQIQLDAAGMIVSQSISGMSKFRAPLDEQFTYADGLAQWRTTGHSGSKRSKKAAFYVPTEWGALAALEALVQVAVKNIEGEIALFPSGIAKVERLVTTQVQAPDGPVDLSLFAISGLDFTPRFAWFDESLKLIAEDRGRMGMLPVGWDPVMLGKLAVLQAQQNGLMQERLSRALSHPQTGTVIFSNANLVDVATGTLLSGYQVMVRDGKIAAISNLPLNIEGALNIDASGKTMIPGLWDMHGHFDLSDGILNIASGITSVRDLGSNHERIMELVAKFNSGLVIGPTTYRAGMIDQVSPYANRNPAKDLDEALAFVDKFAADGYIQIKLYSSIDPTWVPAIAKRAHQHGMRLSGHVPAFMSADQAVRAGYNEIQHMNMVFLNFLAGDREDTRQQLRFTLFFNQGGNLDLGSPEVAAFIALLKQNNVVIDPTASIIQSSLTHVTGQADPMFAAVAENLPPFVSRSLYTPWFAARDDQRQDWANTEQRMSEMLLKLHENGITLVAGSDNLAGFAIHRELELYARAGISNADVLKIATLGAAQVLGVDGETGSITTGKAADLVLLDGNPLDDISAVRRAVLVMKAGVMFNPAALYRALGVRPVVEDEAWWEGLEAVRPGF